tara:strand:- start:9177 stop:9746 length:570 start_codon:yes stop_codon:yes gene_type:complete
MLKQCNFKFKGNRDYIHSTDIYKYLLNHYSKVNSLELIFKLKSKNQLIFIDNLEKGLIDKKNVFCFGKLNKKKIFFLKTKKKIKYSYKFNENMYNEIFKINKTSIKCIAQIKGDFIDLIVCMINYFHRKKFPKKKYLLVKLNQFKKIDFNSLKKQNLEIKTNLNIYSPISVNKVYINKKKFLEIIYINN